MSRLSESWDRILKWIKANTPETLDTLNPGASMAEIEELERYLNIRFPDSVREFYLICNGHHTFSHPLLPDFYYIIPLSQIRDEWEIQRDLLIKNPELELDTETPYAEHVRVVASASPKVRVYGWALQWIPIASNFSGDLYCLDYAPSPQGQIGQIVEYWHDADMRPLIADSFEDWLSQYADDLENGKYFYEAESDGIFPKDRNIT